MTNQNNICGIDFGTSNSTIGTLKNNKPILINIEENNPTTPSAIFYEDEYNEIVYGNKAIDYYKNNYSGRLLRSFKSVLGTSLMEEKTKVLQVNVPFTKIIEDFLLNLKTKAEEVSQQQFDYATIGRPINFVDNDDAKNKLAQDTLEKIAKNIGFKQVNFQFEPIAAALKYEQTLNKEELVLIIDIGGGTTDISVINLSPEFIDIDDRKQHCLANYGVHIGGTDFDKHLSLNSVMPLLGLGDKMPKHIYHEIATWHRINNIYSADFIRYIKQFKNRLDEPYFERINNILTERLASNIAFDIENAKIELSSKENVLINLNYIEDYLTTNITQQDMQNALNNDLTEISKAINECLKQANITKQHINSVFLTGGSSKMQIIKQHVQTIFPNLKIDNQDSLSSVGTGLVLDAAKNFS